MKRFKRIVAMLMACMLCTVCLACAAEAPGTYKLGGKIDDFTVTTYDGRTVTLSEVLQEKEAVLINIWATWCGPCRNEFPFMEEAYKQYSDRVEIIALSIEPTDTADVLADFAAEMGMTFPVAQDTVGLAERFEVSAIPTSIMIDRFGTICFWEAGSMPDVGSFTRLFDAFLGEAYTESVTLTEVPPMKPTVAPCAPADLAAALGTADAVNPTEEYVWPMVVTEKDGRTVVASTNAAQDGTTAQVTVSADAKAGDAIVVTFKTSTEAACDLLTIAVNGEAVKVFGGEHDWMTYAIPVETDGVSTVTLSYVKNAMTGGGEDTVWVDTVAVVSGDEAAAALAANPAYPIADKNALLVANDGAKEILISDDNGLLMNVFGPATAYFIINDDTVTFHAALTEDVDPEGAFVYCFYDDQSIALTSVLKDGTYAFSTGVDAMETTGYSYAYVLLALDPTGEDMVITVYFRNEENVNAFVTEYALGTWRYLDGTVPGTETQPEETAAAVTEAAYTVRYVDQDGNAVTGVLLQVCNDETCQVFASDENGVCAFTLAPYPWELHTLRIPAGYAGDTTTITVAPVEGGEFVFSLTRQ